MVPVLIHLEPGVGFTQLPLVCYFRAYGNSTHLSGHTASNTASEYGVALLTNAAVPNR